MKSKVHEFRLKKRIMLTGGTGFIGTHLAKHVRSLGHEVHVITRRPAPSLETELAGNVHLCSLTDGPGLQHLFEKVQPQMLIHLAGRAFPSRNFEDFTPQFENTVLPALTLARVLPKDLELALFFGSCEEYGNGHAPFHEDQVPKSFSPYGWGKISSFFGTQMIANQRGLPWSWIRLFLTYGPGQRSNQLIPSTIEGCLQGKTLPLSEGMQTRDFLYVNDLCRMVERILKNPDPAKSQILNLCTGQERTVRSVATLIQEKIGRGRLDFGALPYRAEEAMTFYGLNDKFMRLYGDFQFTDFEKALDETIADHLARLSARSAAA